MFEIHSLLYINPLIAQASSIVTTINYISPHYTSIYVHTDGRDALAVNSTIAAHISVSPMFSARPTEYVCSGVIPS